MVAPSKNPTENLKHIQKLAFKQISVQFVGL